MSQASIAAYMLHARVAALAGEALESVRAQGGRLYDARYAQLKSEFEGRITAARMLTDPLEIEVAATRREIEALPAVVKNERDQYVLPTDWRLLAMVALLGLWIMVTHSEWVNAASRQLHLYDSWEKAMQATAPWLAVPVVVECLLIL